MKFFVGLIIVIGCVLGGYAAMGGKLAVLNQPFELVIIGGAAIGAYIISNSPKVLKATGGAFGDLLKGSPYTKQSYVDLLSLQYTIFKLAKTKGMLALESHIENPEESSIFSQFPSFMKNHHAVEFFCDYLRLITMGSEDPHKMEDLMDAELETHHHEREETAGAMQTMADGVPALGIVAAVLGVIKTMGSLDKPPEYLGKLIGGALVGTFLGVFLAYGIIGPIASFLNATYAAEGKYFQCIKAGLMAHMNGFAPSISVEYARKVLTSDIRPSFTELENTVNELPPVQ